MTADKKETPETPMFGGTQPQVGRSYLFAILLALVTTLCVRSRLVVVPPCYTRCQGQGIH
jgi:hypothetical protein